MTERACYVLPMRATAVVLLLLCLAASAKPSNPAARLVGTWSIDPTDQAGIKAFGRCSMQFEPNGQLIYSLPDGKMVLTYRVLENVLITDQPSHPREERTPSSFAADGSLVLVAPDGQPARFLKQARAGR